MAKTVVEDCLIINIDKLNRDGILSVGSMGTISWSGGSKIGFWTTERDPDCELVIQLDFSCKGENITQVVPITWTDVYNGGRRPWFICPVYHNGHLCHRRVGKLYKPYYAKLFACRHCWDLSYRSRQEWVHPRNRWLFRWMNRIFKG